jgi:hypothetical protein
MSPSPPANARSPGRVYHPPFLISLSAPNRSRRGHGTGSTTGGPDYLAAATRG